MRARLETLLGNVRFKTLIHSLALMMIACMVVMQAIFLWSMYTFNHERAIQFLEFSAGQLHESAVAFNQHMDRLSTDLAFNSAAMRFIECTEAVGWYRQNERLATVIGNALIADDSLDRVIYTDLDLINIGVYDRSDFVILREIKRLVDSGEQQFAQGQHLNIDGMPVYVRKSGYNMVLDRQYYLVLRYNTLRLQNAVDSIASDEEQMFYLLCGEDQVILHSSSITPAQSAALQPLLTSRPDGIYTDNGYIGIVLNIPQVNWRWVSAIPDARSNAPMSRIAFFSLLITAVLAMLLLFTAVSIRRNIVNPVNNIIRFMSSVGEDYASHRLKVTQRNEIGELADMLNDMLHKIDTMNRSMIKAQQRTYLAELDKRQTELSALYSQINPHFLYNTLDCIRSIGAIHNLPLIVEITSAMAKIFRYSIKSRSFVRVHEEMACIRDYMHILQIRYRNSFVEEYRVDETCMGMVIPKMILQPLVENAVFHGLEQMRAQGVLRVAGWLDEGALCFEIRDNGRGMEPETLAALYRSLDDPDLLYSIHLRDKKSIGLANIHARIRLLCGPEYGLSLTSGENGTVVRLRLPVFSASDLASLDDPAAETGR